MMLKAQKLLLENAIVPNVHSFFASIRTVGAWRVLLFTTHRDSSAVTPDFFSPLMRPAYSPDLNQGTGMLQRRVYGKK